MRARAPRSMREGRAALAEQVARAPPLRRASAPLADAAAETGWRRRARCADMGATAGARPDFPRGAQPSCGRLRACGRVCCGDVYLPAGLLGP